MTQPQFKVTLNFGVMIPSQVVLFKGRQPSSWVVWQAFRPNSLSTIAWEERYSLYAADEAPTPGARLETFIRMDDPAPGRLYTFTAHQMFSSQSSSVPGNEPHVRNEGTRPMTFGLAQDITVDGRLVTGAPVSAKRIPLQAQEGFDSSNLLTICVMSDVHSGQVFDRLPWNASSFRLGEVMFELNLEYQEGRFVQQQQW